MFVGKVMKFEIFKQLFIFLDNSLFFEKLKIFENQNFLTNNIISVKDAKVL
jgi:hypothetical protein